MITQEQFDALESRVAALELKKKKATPAKKQPVIGVSVNKFVDILATSGKVLTDVVDPSTFGTIGKKLNAAGVTDDDVEAFRVWVDSGGLNWVREPFAWNAICRAPKFLLLDWIARAKAYTKPDVAPASTQLSFNFDKFLRATKDGAA